MSARPIDVKTRDAGRNARGRVFRKYLIIILVPVSIAVSASGAISAYLFQEFKTGLGKLQHEKAVAAASWIEQYVRQIEGKLTYAARPQLDASDIESRRIEFLQVLRQVPDVTDVALHDANDREQIAVSRLGRDVTGSSTDRSQEPASLNTKPGKTWFGPVFRRATQPYMTIAIRSPDRGPLIVADVSLSFVSRLKIYNPGKVYVVDSNGFVIAHPEIDKPLRNIDVSDLPPVKAAAAEQNPNAPAMVSKNPAGTLVLTSFAQIQPLHWFVFVEHPIPSLYQELYVWIPRTGLLLLAGLFISVVGAWAASVPDRVNQKID